MKGDFVKLLYDERQRQLEKWGEDPPDKPDEVWLQIICKEVMEIDDALKSGDMENLKEEIVQVATVCMAWMQSKGWG